MKFMDILGHCRPKYWIMEEVKNVAHVTNLGRLVKNDLHLKPGEYRLIKHQEIHFIKACDHGYPHIRKRLFAGHYPRLKPTRKVKPRVKTPIAQARGYYHGKKDHVRVLKQLRGLIQESDRQDLKRSEIMKNPIHPDVWKWLMSFPRDYVVCGSKQQQFEQIGNAVMPAISKLLYNKVKRNERVQVQRRLW